MQLICTKTAPALTQATQLASTLIEAMLSEMQNGLDNPHRLESEEWARIFGDKQSMVVNLQKLVQSLAALTEPPVKQPNGVTDYPEGAAMNMQDMQILLAWLGAEQGA